MITGEQLPCCDVLKALLKWFFNGFGFGNDSDGRANWGRYNIWTVPVTQQESSCLVMCWKLYCKAAKICRQLGETRYVGFNIKPGPTGYVKFSDIKSGTTWYDSTIAHRKWTKQSSNLLVKSTNTPHPELKITLSQIQNTPSQKLNTNYPKCQFALLCPKALLVMNSCTFWRNISRSFWHDKLIFTVGSSRSTCSSSS